MQLQELNDVWRRFLGNGEPVAHLLRDQLKNRWVRFHSLPESKRYPESEEEMAIVLERHNRLISRLAGDDEVLTLLSTEYSTSASPSRSDLGQLGVCEGEVAWRSVAMNELSEDLEEPTNWNVFSSVVRWYPGVLSIALCLVAEDKATNVMLMARKGGLYHPYDGGADVILPTEEQRNVLSGEFSAWLSKHPLGL